MGSSWRSSRPNYSMGKKRSLCIRHGSCCSVFRRWNEGVECSEGVGEAANNNNESVLRWYEAEQPRAPHPTDHSERVEATSAASTGFSRTRTSSQIVTGNLLFRFCYWHCDTISNLHVGSSAQSPEKSAPQRHIERIPTVQTEPAMRRHGPWNVPSTDCSAAVHFKRTQRTDAGVDGFSWWVKREIMHFVFYCNFYSRFLFHCALLFPVQFCSNPLISVHFRSCLFISVLIRSYSFIYIHFRLFTSIFVHLRSFAFISATYVGVWYMFTSQCNAARKSCSKLSLQSLLKLPLWTASQAYTRWTTSQHRDSAIVWATVWKMCTPLGRCLEHLSHCCKTDKNRHVMAAIRSAGCMWATDSALDFGYGCAWNIGELLDITWCRTAKGVGIRLYHCTEWRKQPRNKSSWTSAVEWKKQQWTAC